MYLVRVCVRQFARQIGFADGSEKRSGDRERITVRGDRAGQGLFEQVVIQSAATAARRWAGSIRADACNAEKVQLCRNHPYAVNRLNFEGFIPDGLIQLGRGIEVAGVVHYNRVAPHPLRHLANLYFIDAISREKFEHMTGKTPF